MDAIAIEMEMLRFKLMRTPVFSAKNADAPHRTATSSGKFTRKDITLVEVLKHARCVVTQNKQLIIETIR
ncbi:MAG: hypothetical protein FJ266_08860 [Planctomycetes bacterium]|nr:hypothetical protein [Planctomycetota bacterium]